MSCMCVQMFILVLIEANSVWLLKLGHQMEESTDVGDSCICPTGLANPSERPAHQTTFSSSVELVVELPLREQPAISIKERLDSYIYNQESELLIVHLSIISIVISDWLVLCQHLPGVSPQLGCHFLTPAKCFLLGIFWEIGILKNVRHPPLPNSTVSLGNIGLWAAFQDCWPVCRLMWVTSQGCQIGTVLGGRVSIQQARSKSQEIQESRGDWCGPQRQLQANHLHLDLLTNPSTSYGTAFGLCHPTSLAELTFNLWICLFVA